MSPGWPRIGWGSRQADEDRGPSRGLADHSRGARAHDMQIMLSAAWSRSSVGVTAAAHLAPLCDYADLDGPLLIKNDPYSGLKYDGAKMTLPEGAGLGVVRNT